MSTCFINVDDLFSLPQITSKSGSIDLLVMESVLRRLSPGVTVERFPETDIILSVQLAQGLTSELDLPVVAKFFTSC